MLPAFACAVQAWLSYAKLEVRADEIDRARAIYERYVANHPTETAFIRYAKWELRHQQRALARAVFERSLEELADVSRLRAFAGEHTWCDPLTARSWAACDCTGPRGEVHRVPPCIEMRASCRTRKTSGCTSSLAASS